MRIIGAAAYVVIAALAGLLLGLLPLPRPQQLVGSAPWVSNVSPVLLGAVAANAVVFSLVSLVLLRGWAPELGWWARGSLAAIIAAMVVVAAWSAVYAASLSEAEAVIPIVNWTWPAVATAAAAGVVGPRHGAVGGLTAGWVAVAPVVALDAMGWSLHSGGSIGAWTVVAVLDGFGIGVGSLFALTGAGRTWQQARHTAPSADH